MRFPASPAVGLLLAVAAPWCAAQTPVPRWYATAIGGASLISDPRVTYVSPGGAVTSGTFALDRGVMAGGSLGWYATPDWRVEGDYIYRSNKLRSSTVPGLDASPSDADYASVLIMANLVRQFDGWQTTFATFRPYVGAGVGIAQEIDTDSSIGGQQREFSGRRFAWQALAGIDWSYRSPWFAGVGLRYVDAGTVRLEGTNGGGELKADYKGLGLELRLGYRF